MNPNDHFHHHHQHQQHLKPANPSPIPHHPSHEHNTNIINGIGPGGGGGISASAVSAFSAAGIGHPAGHSPGSTGLFFPHNSFLQVGHKPPSADNNCITLEAMLNSTKQLNSTAGPLQLVDFKDTGVDAGAGTSADQDRNMMLKRQATRFFRSSSSNTMYDQGGSGLGDDMSMQDYSLMDQDGDYDAMGSGDKKLGAIGSGRRLGYDQVKALEKAFEVENRLEPERKMRLASQLGLQPRQVAVWFQNRRARWKTKQMERDYTLLKNKFDALKADRDKLLREKDNLQAEIVRLKGQSSNDEEKQPGDQDSPTLASCSLVDDAANQAHVGEENIDNATPDDMKVENGSLSSTEGSDNINGDIEDSSSHLQNHSSSLKPINEESDLHWKPFNPPPQAMYRNNVKNEEWENGEQNTFNMSMEWPYSW